MSLESGIQSPESVRTALNWLDFSHQSTDPANAVVASPGPAAEQLPSAILHPVQRHNKIKEGIAGDMMLHGITNKEYVDLVNEDSRTPAATEWLVLAGVGGAKAGGKAWFAQKLASAAGDSAARVGLGLGLGTGAVLGVYTAYHLSSIWRNSMRIDAFKERLLQGYDPQKPVAQNEPNYGTGLPPRQAEWHLGVTDAVDAMRPAWGATLGPAWDAVRRRVLHRSPEPSLEDLSRAHADISDARYIQWSEKASNYTVWGQAAHDAFFGGTGYLGGMYVAAHMIPGVGKYAMIAKVAVPVVRAFGAVLGVGLSRITTMANEREMQADLLQERLMQHANYRN
jgi:hypothetical protein